MFRTTFTRAALFSFGFVLAATAANARPATCYLAVGDSVLIDGPCDFEPLYGDGSFQINGYDGQYFALVSILGNGIAEGWWNLEPYGQNAQGRMGTLYRNDACWSNDFVTVCAW